jgi:GntR family transcriptional regulator
MRSDEGTLHGQLYRTLFRQISDGEIRVGERLPTEAELSERYSVSRTTARRALDELRRAALVERLPGRGTFVVEPRLKTAIPQLHSITAEIEALGYRAESQLIGLSETEATEEEKSDLKYERAGPVLHVERLRRADGRPFNVADSTLNLEQFPQLRDADYAASDLSMYKLFEQVSGRKVSRVVQWLSAAPASRYVARYMEVPERSPVLLLERVLFVEGNIPIERVRAFFRGEIYKFYSELTMPL